MAEEGADHVGELPRLVRECIFNVPTIFTVDTTVENVCGNPGRSETLWIVMRATSEVTRLAARDELLESLLALFITEQFKAGVDQPKVIKEPALERTMRPWENFSGNHLVSHG